MTSYTKSTNFATKDTLTSGDPLKIVKGTEINTEFDNIATAVNSKSDTASPTFTGTVTIPTLALSGLTASSAVATNASNALVSVTNTGTGNNVLATSPTLVTPILGTPTSGTLTNATGLPLTTGVTGVLPEANGGTGTTTGYYGFKNRIINGAMVIDQRNAGASVTPTGSQYTLDRWTANISVTSKFSVQRSTTAPTGYSNSLLVTSLSAYSVLTGDYFTITQPIEGFNFADMAWGTASASAITISFWVRSSLTGTFGGALLNASGNRSYPFTYTISSANTFEQKTVTIAGDTTGTWGTGNGVGVFVQFGLGAGATYSGTAGAWAGANYASATGSTSVVGTNTATFYITGVQLEKGSTATSFDYRPYGTELALCQRYCIGYGGQSLYERFGLGLNSSTTEAYPYIPFPVEMRSIPTLTYSSLSHFSLWNGTILGAPTAITADSASGGGGNKYATFSCLKTGLTANAVIGLIANNTTSARLTFSSEL